MWLRRSMQQILLEYQENVSNTDNFINLSKNVTLLMSEEWKVLNKVNNLEITSLISIVEKPVNFNEVWLNCRDSLLVKLH